MGRRSLTSTLYVYLNEVLVGSLTKKSAGQLSFQYDETWLQNKTARPISLSIPLTEQEISNDNVYHFFDNLLPDNDSIRARIQKRFNIPTNQCFDILAAIGKDCVGAIQLRSEPIHNQDLSIQSKPLSEKTIAALIRQYKQAPLGMMSDTDFRISIAGAQEKTALLMLNERWHMPEGSTPTTHIIKLPIGHIEHSGMDLSDSVENEWICLQILKAYQMKVCPAEIQTFEDQKVLVCERFDRKFNEDKSIIYRLPQEDMCQVFGISSALKYESDGGPGIEQVMDFLVGSIQPEQDREIFFKTCFIYWVLGAIDGHAKNFSVFIKQHGRYILTPNYDVLSAYPLFESQAIQPNKIKMAMSVHSKNKHYHWHSIQLRHWQEQAKRCKLPAHVFKRIIEQVSDELEGVIRRVHGKINSQISQTMADSIFKGMRQVKNLKLSD